MPVAPTVRLKKILLAAAADTEAPVVESNWYIVVVAVRDVRAAAAKRLLDPDDVPMPAVAGMVIELAAVHLMTAPVTMSVLPVGTV